MKRGHVIAPKVAPKGHYSEKGYSLFRRVITPKGHCSIVRVRIRVRVRVSQFGTITLRSNDSF